MLDRTTSIHYNSNTRRKYTNFVELQNRRTNKFYFKFLQTNTGNEKVVQQFLVFGEK